MPDDEIFGKDVPEGNLADAVLDAMNKAEDKTPPVKADENEQPPVEETPENKGEEKAPEVTDEQLSKAQSDHDKRRDLFNKLETATEGYDSRIESIIASTVAVDAGKQTETAAKKTEAPADDGSGQDVATKDDLKDILKEVRELVGQAVSAPQRTQALAELHDLAAKLKENDILTDENVKEAESFLNSLDASKVSWPEAAKAYRRIIKGMASENILAKKDFTVVDMKAKKQAQAKAAAQPAGQAAPANVKETDDEKLIRTLHEVGGDPTVMDNLFNA